MLFLKVKAFLFFQECINIAIYYKNFRFALFDSLLKIVYLFQNPYRISRRFLEKKRKENIHQYGETPLVTFEKMARVSVIKPYDIFYELGSGRGRLCFWMHAFEQCKVIGVEQIPSFVTMANFLVKLLRRKNLHFIKGDITQIDLSDATIIYLCGTCLSDEEIYKTLQNLKSITPKTRLWSISYSLADYDATSYKVLREIPVQFAWGKTSAYLQEKL